METISLVNSSNLWLIQSKELSHLSQFLVSQSKLFLCFLCRSLQVAPFTALLWGEDIDILKGFP